MTKVKLTKEVAEAIESWLNNYGDESALLIEFTSYKGEWTSEYKPLETIDIMTLASALVNGYEVEKTPEELEAERKERVREYYEKHCIYDNPTPYQNGLKVGMHATLNQLGIKIEGVNDKC